MSTLNRKFNEDLVITKKRLDETRALVDKEIAGMMVVKHLQRPWFILERRKNNVIVNLITEYPDFQLKRNQTLKAE